MRWVNSGPLAQWAPMLPENMSGLGHKDKGNYEHSHCFEMKE